MVQPKNSSAVDFRAVGLSHNPLEFQYTHYSEFIGTFAMWLYPRF